MLGYHTVLLLALGCLSAIVASSPLPVAYGRTSHRLVPIVREGENAFEPVGFISCLRNEDPPVESNNKLK